MPENNPIAEFIEQNYHEDARRRAFYNLVPDLAGQLSFNDIPNGVIIGLHMHKQQVDYFAVAKGRMMFRLVTEDGREEKIILSPCSRKTLIIRPGIWHGYKSLEPSILVSYVTEKYNPADEFRKKTAAADWETEIR